jgi:hypothetical protein
MPFQFVLGVDVDQLLESEALCRLHAEGQRLFMTVKVTSRDTNFPSHFRGFAVVDRC